MKLVAIVQRVLVAAVLALPTSLLLADPHHRDNLDVPGQARTTTNGITSALQPILPQAEPDFGVFIDLQSVVTNAPAEEATRLIVYYRNNATSSSGPTTKEDADIGGDDLFAKPQSRPADDPAPTPAPEDQLVRNDQLSVVTEFGAGQPLTFPVPVSMATAAAFAAELERDPDVAAVLVDRRVGRHSISTNDSLNYVMWNLGTNSVGTAAAEPVWPQGQGSGVTVAVLDTGRVNHPDMLGAWIGGYDLITDTGLAGDGDGRDADPTDTMSCDDGSGPVPGNPHGLQVGSIIAARVNNNEGIAGVSPSASILPVRVISGCGGWLSDVLDGMRWAVGLPVAGLPTNPNPARVLNLSLGTTSPGVACSPTVQSIVDEVRATGATIVVSTGNDGADAISVPAACNGVIAVTASTKFGNRASYANAGAGTTMSAPGGGCQTGADPTCFQSAYNYVPVANHDGSTTNYVVSAGTSFAAPHVAGAAALLLERNPARSPDDIESALVNAARAFAPGGCDGGLCGAGMLDVDASLASQGFSVTADVSPSAARGGDVVTMTANVSSGTNSPVYSWTQTAGTAVTLVGADTATATFTAPQVDETLSFQVVVTDTSGLQRFANGSTAVTIAPELAPLGTVEVDPNAELRQAVVLTNGSVPDAISVDATAASQGVTVDGNEVVWTAPASGQFTFVVTPFDSVGSGISSDLSVLVKGTHVTATNNPAAGGATGLHGALLLLLAWFGRRRLLNRDRDTHSFAPVLGAMVAGLFVVGYSAPMYAASATLNFNLWIASLLHFNVTHLAVNLAGMFLLGIAFAGSVQQRAWWFALLVAAPASHWLVLQSGQYSVAAGLSTALHAVVAWTAVQLLVGGLQLQRRAQWQFALLVAAGLVFKVLLDGVWVTVWPEQNAQTVSALHALSALIAASASLCFSRLGLFPFATARPQR